MFCWLGLMVAATAGAQTDYDFLLKGGHVIDGKNGISAVRDVAIKDGRIAAVTTNIAAARALKTIDATGFYVTPGLFDMHVHVCTTARSRTAMPKATAASIRTASHCEAA